MNVSIARKHVVVARHTHARNYSTNLFTAPALPCFPLMPCSPAVLNASLFGLASLYLLPNILVPLLLLLPSFVHAVVLVTEPRRNCTTGLKV